MKERRKFECKRFFFILNLLGSASEGSWTEGVNSEELSWEGERALGEAALFMLVGIFPHGKLLRVASALLQLILRPISSHLSPPSINIVHVGVPGHFCWSRWLSCWRLVDS